MASARACSRGRARGLAWQIFVCKDPAGLCSDVSIAGVAIDDRALRVSAGARRPSFTLAHGAEDVTREVASWRLDTQTGEARSAGACELDPEVAPFFREPMPTWVLDSMVGRAERADSHTPDAKTQLAEAVFENIGSRSGHSYRADCTSRKDTLRPAHTRAPTLR